MKVLAFSTSNSRSSINKTMVNYLANLIPGASIKLSSVNDYILPIYDPELEKENGVLQPAKDFYNDIEAADLIIIGYAEHNGNYTAAFKNLLDWTSRINMGLFQQKPTIMLAATPGQGGAKSVLNIAQNSSAFFKNDIRSVISIPDFYNTFDLKTNQCTSAELEAKLLNAVDAITAVTE
ncbi:NADPH-dependent FMN reductase [Photobacterium minamisatsumaniensis]|uniref:NADPH-dependent FMN reductase n=1 Tax=Photobacterium minamisatsumaniensis TaxID=2910233 RepID=UPI003D11CD6A